MGWEHGGHCTQRPADHVSSMIQWPGWGACCPVAGKDAYSVTHTKKAGMEPPGHVRQAPVPLTGHSVCGKEARLLSCCSDPELPT